MKHFFAITPLTTAEVLSCDPESIPPLTLLITADSDTDIQPPPEAVLSFVMWAAVGSIQIPDHIKETINVSLTMFNVAQHNDTLIAIGTRDSVTVSWKSVDGASRLSVQPVDPQILDELRSILDHLDRQAKRKDARTT